jgi:hypothetical protein
MFERQPPPTTETPSGPSPPPLAIKDTLQQIKKERQRQEEQTVSIWSTQKWNNEDEKNKYISLFDTKINSLSEE